MTETITPMRSLAAPIRVADFFCGCGGTSAGLRAAGMTIALGLDFDADAGATYQRNFPEARFLLRNILDVDLTEVDELREGEDTPLLLSACAPCQPYSSFVKKSGPDVRRALLLRLLPIVERLRPEFVLIENVPGLKGAHSPAGTFARFCRALERAGYSVDHKIVDCRDYGVPQRRRRLVILASLLGPISVPLATHGEGSSLSPSSTVWDWIGDLPPVAPGEEHPDVPNHLVSAITDINLRRLRATPPGGGRADWPAALRLACHKDDAAYTDTYGRMHAHAAAPVLTTKCTSISNGRFGHPFADRPISVREAACLQTFPRDFIFEGGIRSATRQIGNAVPVLLAQVMGERFTEQWAALGAGLAEA